MSRHHRIDYIEFPADDIQETKRFYAAAFGWEFTDYASIYAGIAGGEPGTDRGGEMGGIAQREHAASHGPLVIVFSEDLEASLASVRAAGARIVKEPYDFPGGRRFEFEDPNGHHLAVWTE